jgi:hypothetical protein
MLKVCIINRDCYGRLQRFFISEEARSFQTFQTLEIWDLEQVLFLTRQASIHTPVKCVTFHHSFSFIRNNRLRRQTIVALRKETFTLLDSSCTISWEGMDPGERGICEKQKLKVDWPRKLYKT